jgi:peptide/nickel transport system substrate-binding protein
VVIGYPAAITSLLPNRSVEEFTTAVSAHVYETLVFLDPALRLRPCLAESWHNDDDSTWVFRLRPGVRLHDGRLLEARHVVEALEDARTSGGSVRRAELGAVSAIEERDPRTVVVHTRFPSAVIPARLAGVFIGVPASAAGDPPVGTGAYRVRSRDPHATVLEAFPEYWGRPPAIAVREFRALPVPADRVRALRDRAVDLILDVPAEDVAGLRAAGRRVVSEEGLRVVFLGLATGGAAPPARTPFRDPRVRQAVAAAVDREAIRGGPLGGHAEVADQVVPPVAFGNVKGLAVPRFDPASARRLLAEAGYRGGLSTTLDFVPGKYRGIDGVVAAVVRDLAAVGIRVTPRPSDPAGFFQRVERQDTSMYLMGWLGTSGDAGVTFDILLRTPGGGFGRQNGAGFSDPEFDRLLADASRAMQPARRRQLLEDAGRRLAALAPVVPLYRERDLYGLVEELDLQPRADRSLIGGDTLRWRR